MGLGGDVDDVDGLALVADVLVAHIDVAFGVEHRLERNERGACEAGSVEPELDVDRFLETLRYELLLGRDLVALCIEHGLAGGFVHELANYFVGFAGDASRVGDAVDDRHVAARLALMGAAVPVGRGGAHGLGHVLDHDGELCLHGFVAHGNHALVVHLEVVDAGFALVVDVVDDVAVRRGDFLHVVAAVLQVLQGYNAACVGCQSLIEIARVIPDPEGRTFNRGLAID